MPKDFTDCVKNGGKVKTKNLKGNKYMHICYDKNGKSHAGEVKTKSKKKAKANKMNKKIQDSRRLADSLSKLKEHFNEHYHTN